MSLGTTCFHVFPVRDYDLEATLDSGQAFRWRRTRLGISGAGATTTLEPRDACERCSWIGIVSNRWVRLSWIGGSVTDAAKIIAETAVPQTDWQWLADFLQVQVNLRGVVATFPEDAPLSMAVNACWGLRLLRQDPWECLASFICSSTKQIVQIRQIVDRLCKRFGDSVPVPDGDVTAFTFPSAQRLASASERELRNCLMGFRAPYLSATARAIANNSASLRQIGTLPLEEARAALMAFPGVGRKIADCVLLFAYGFPTAFPIDVWVLKALRGLYFARRHVTMNRLQHFSETHFGPQGGYAQQYLFHYMRRRRRKPLTTLLERGADALLVPSPPSTSKPAPADTRTTDDIMLRPAS